MWVILSRKSSVLEAVVGRDFLPRSAGICTRRPLVVSLEKTEAGSKEEGEFGHRKVRETERELHLCQEVQNGLGSLLSPFRREIFTPLVLLLKLSPSRVLAWTFLTFEERLRLKRSAQLQERMCRRSLST